MRLNETFSDEVLAAKLQDFASESEHSVDMGSAQVEEAIVQSGIKFNIDSVRDT